MEGCKRKEEDCPKLLDLIARNGEWVTNRDAQKLHGFTEEKKLELSLAPPGEEHSKIKENTKINCSERDDSLLSLKCFSSLASNNNLLPSPQWSSSSSSGFQQSKQPGFLQFSPSTTAQNLSVMGESSQPCCNRAVRDLHSADQKAFSPPPAKTAVTNSSQKRTAPAPVVGWPPIRSFRKNLATSSSSKLVYESENVLPKKVGGEKPIENNRKGLFVKINMDGVPIGRKVDLKAYDSYEGLSFAVDELFRGLLAAQTDTVSSGNQNEKVEEKAITGLLDGKGEYTLVYEDNEGDRMLVGDVPWHMFVSTVKRLRVLKSSELPALCLGSSKEKMRFDKATK